MQTDLTEPKGGRGGSYHAGLVLSPDLEIRCILGIHCEYIVIISFLCLLWCILVFLSNGDGPQGERGGEGWDKSKNHAELFDPSDPSVVKILK